MELLTSMLTFVLAAYLPISSTAVNISFSPESEKFTEATREYQKIWSEEGRRMIEAMESVSGLKFQETDIKAIVYEGVSYSGYKESPMKLRASYPTNVKKATLIHELGHRLNNPIIDKPEGIDEHRLLFLYLYDVWEKLYGKSFADEMVVVEKKRKGIYDYEMAWNWALSLSKEERASKLKEALSKNNITAVFRCEKRRVIKVNAAGSAGLFARRLLIQVQSAVSEVSEPQSI